MCKGAIFLFHYLISQTIGPCGICLVLRDSVILGSEGKKNKTKQLSVVEKSVPLSLP